MFSSISLSLGNDPVSKHLFALEVPIGMNSAEVKVLVLLIGPQRVCMIYLHALESSKSLLSVAFHCSSWNLLRSIQQKKVTICAQPQTLAANGDVLGRC